MKDKKNNLRKNKMSQKLKDFKKILLATGTINYMTSALEEVREDFLTMKYKS